MSFVDLTVNGRIPLREEWGAVGGFEGLYEVSSFGRVRSLGRNGRSSRGGRRIFPSQLMTQFNRRGYPSVALRSTSGESRMFTVHRLVARAFIGAIPDGMQINHIDGCKHNNRVDNLEIVTPRQNMGHAARTGLLHPAIGESSGQARATEAEVAIARRAADRGIPLSQIANVLGLAIPTISNMVNEVTWKHVGASK